METQQQLAYSIISQQQLASTVEDKWPFLGVKLHLRISEKWLL